MDITNAKTICVYIHHSANSKVAHADVLAVRELLHYNDWVIFSSNLPIQRYVFEHIEPVCWVQSNNDLYDFSKFLTAFQIIKNNPNLTRLTVLNDSNLYFDSLKNVFDYFDNTQADLLGLVESNEKPSYSQLKDNWHVQSHVFCFKGHIISNLEGFIQQFPIQQITSKSDLKSKKQQIILAWEIGLSQFFLKKGLKVVAMIKNPENIGKNIMLKKPQLVVNSGANIVKKRYLKSILPKFLFFYIKNLPLRNRLIWFKSMANVWINYWRYTIRKLIRN